MRIITDGFSYMKNGRTDALVITTRGPLITTTSTPYIKKMEWTRMTLADAVDIDTSKRQHRDF